MTHPQLGLFLLGIILLSSTTSGYNTVVEPLSGRTFSLFNFLTPFTTTSSSALLPARVSALETNLAILATQVALATERCPASAILLGAQLIGTYCYSVSKLSEAAPFSVALGKCLDAGGSLAEPLPTPVASTNLYKALKAAFKSKFATIEASNGGQFWIGYYVPTTSTSFNYQSVTTGIAVPPTPTIGLIPSIVNTFYTAIGTSTSSAALLTPNNVPITYWAVGAQASPFPFICQYTALA